jgi:hypothetical protein
MENINKQEIEWDEDNEKQEDPVEDQEDEICIATKTDGHPCLGLKYKDTDYCYSHLTKMKMLPSRVVPVELPKRGRPKKIQIDPSFHQVAPAIVKQVAPVAPVASTSVSDNDDLVLKLTQRLKMKIDAIDTETKMLLKLLL